MLVVAPQVEPSSTLVDIYTFPLTMLALMEDDIALLAIRAPSSLGGDGEQPKEIPMEIVEVSMMLDEAFVVEAVMPLKRVSIEVSDVTFLSTRMSGMGNVSIFNLHA